MTETYVLDACALIAFLADEEGANKVEALLKKAESPDCFLYMNKVNVLEIYYGIYREEGKARADETFDLIMILPISIVDELEDIVFKEAGRIKATRKLSLADAILLGRAKIMNAKVVSSDHHEFDSIEEQEELEFLWIR